MDKVLYSILNIVGSTASSLTTKEDANEIMQT